MTDGNRIQVTPEMLAASSGTTKKLWPYPTRAGADVIVGRGARIRRAIIDKDVKVPKDAVIGYDADHDRRRGFTITESDFGSSHRFCPWMPMPLTLPRSLPMHHHWRVYEPSGNAVVNLPE